MLKVVVPLSRPAIAAVGLFSFLYAWNDFFGPLLYVGENTNNWTLSVALANFRSLYHVQWNLTMAATLLFMLPVVLLFFARAEGLRRGRHAHGGQGMKVAVIGGGSTYTPELVSGSDGTVRPPARCPSWS